MALTATANKDTRKKITDALLFNDAAVTVTVNDGRKNIHHSVVNCKGNTDCLNWIVDHLKTEMSSKVIIFCRSVVHVAQIYAYLCESLGDDLYFNQSKRYDSYSIACKM